MQNKKFLFLQGVCSPFFARLAQKLRSEGHQVFKVAFNSGDWWYGGRQRGIYYRGHVKDLAEFLSDCYQRLAITDQVLFGDCRPVHVEARQAAQGCEVRTHVFEEGYFRPYWITLEREGVNANSLLPRNPDWFLAAGEHLPNYGDGQPFKNSFPWRSYHDVAYHVAGMWNPLFFPKYRTHSPVIAPIEYACYIKRMSRTHFREKSDAILIDHLVSKSRKSYFVLPLQLDSDSQIKMHSSFTHMREVIALVLGSFALHAPKYMSLVIKNHPLDSGLVDYELVARELAHEFCLSDRVCE
jgi:capsular polysaccharide export protein